MRSPARGIGDGSDYSILPGDPIGAPNNYAIDKLNISAQQQAESPVKSIDKTIPGRQITAYTQRPVKSRATRIAETRAPFGKKKGDRE